MKQIVIGALIALVLTGCSKLSRENYDQLKMGMTYAQTSAILGKAEHCEDVLGTSSCLWGSEEKNIKIGFIADKATFFSSAGIN
ncbi:MAG: lipoprotein [Aeromonas sp.]